MKKINAWVLGIFIGMMCVVVVSATAFTFVADSKLNKIYSNDYCDKELELAGKFINCDDEIKLRQIDVNFNKDSKTGQTKLDFSEVQRTLHPIGK